MNLCQQRKLRLFKISFVFQLFGGNKASHGTIVTLDLKRDITNYVLYNGPRVVSLNASGE